MTAAALFLIGLPIAFNLAFAALAARFDYPDVLRRPTEHGWKVAERLTPAAYVAWSLWLMATGVALLR